MTEKKEISHTLHQVMEAITTGKLQWDHYSWILFINWNYVMKDWGGGPIKIPMLGHPAWTKNWSWHSHDDIN